MNHKRNKFLRSLTYHVLAMIIDYWVWHRFCFLFSFVCNTTKETTSSGKAFSDIAFYLVWSCWDRAQFLVTVVVPHHKAQIQYKAFERSGGPERKINQIFFPLCPHIRCVGSFFVCFLSVLSFFHFGSFQELHRQPKTFFLFEQCVQRTFATDFRRQLRWRKRIDWDPYRAVNIIPWT